MCPPAVTTERTPDAQTQRKWHRLDKDEQSHDRRSWPERVRPDAGGGRGAAALSAVGATRAGAVSAPLLNAVIGKVACPHGALRHWEWEPDMRNPYTEETHKGVTYSNDLR